MPLLLLLTKHGRLADQSLQRLQRLELRAERCQAEIEQTAELPESGLRELPLLRCRLSGKRAAAELSLLL